MYSQGGTSGIPWDADISIRWSLAPPYDASKNLGGGDCNCGEGSGTSGNSTGTEGAQGDNVAGSPMVGDPINVATGNKFLEADDYTDGSWLNFRRFYNSDTAVISTAMGRLWRHSFDRSIYVDTAASPQTATRFRPDGSSEIYTKAGTAWIAAIDNPNALTETDDSNGMPTSYTVTVAALHHIEKYGGSGLLQSVADENGQGIVLTYSDSQTSASIAPGPGLLLNVTAGNGRSLNFTYGTDGHLHQMIQPDGRTFIYGYDNTGNLTTVQYPDTKVRQYVYNEQDLTGGNNLPSAMTGIIDESGVRFESTSFDSLGRATFTSLAGGAGQTTISYSASSSGITFALGGGATQTFLAPNGHIRTANYDATCKPACGTQWQSRTYDANGYPSSYTDFNGNLNQVTYSPSGLLTEMVEASGTAVQRTTDITWDNTFRRPTLHTLKDAAGNLVTKREWVYNLRGQPLAQCDIDPVKAGTYACAATGTPPEGVRRTMYTYCDVVSANCPLIGLVLTMDGPRTDVTDVTTYSYYTSSSATGCGTPGAACHQAGDLYQVNNALGQKTTIASYDANGRITRITDPNGTNTDFTYTPRGWVLTRTIGGAVTTYGYDAMGDISKVTDADNVFATYTYDAAHRLTDVTDALGSHVHYTLDAAGNRTAEVTYNTTGAVVRKLTRTFDVSGKLTGVTDGLNQQNFRADYPDSYDGNANLVHFSDALGVQANQAFDALNRVKAVTNDYGGTNASTKNAQTLYGYDAKDALTSLTDAGGLTTMTPSDGLSNPTSTTSPDAGMSSETFDASGNGLVHTDARAITATRAYDALGRQTSTSYVDTSLNVSYHYDEANSVTGCVNSEPVGRLTRVVELNVTTTYCYDARGNVISRFQALGTNTDKTSFAYTSANRVKSQTYPDGGVVAYTRDANGRIASAMFTPPGGTATTVVSGITYLPFGTVLSYQLGNGQTVARTYDLNYEVSDVSSPAFSLHVARDAGRNIVALGQSHGAAPADETYSYDALHHLTGISDGGSPVEAYAYNASGDRLSKVAAGLATGTYGYQTGTHRLNVVGSGARTFDANGNTSAVVAAGQNLGLGYNGRNRLTVVQAAGQTVGTYIYNAFGQRVSKTATTPSSTTERFNTGVSGELLSEQGTANRDYVWVDDLPVALFDSGSQGTSISYIHADGLNTPRAVTTGTTVVWQWPYQGNPYGEQQPTGSLTLNLRYAGQYFDMESGLVDNGHRTFEAATGRYLQNDPSGFNGGANLYAYAMQSPLNFIDPTGGVPRSVSWAGWGAATGAIVGGGLAIGADYGTAGLAIPADGAIVAGGAAVGAAGFGALGSFADWVEAQANNPVYAKPPENAYDKDGPKAPGLPTPEDGYVPPKDGPQWVPNPNPGRGGSPWGWLDKSGKVWCPTGPGPGRRAHGGPHWDVQNPDGTNTNIFPQR